MYFSSRFHDSKETTMYESALVAFARGLLTFALVSGCQLAQHNRSQCHFRSAVFSSQLETMVGDDLTRTSDLSVG